MKVMDATLTMMTTMYTMEMFLAVKLPTILALVKDANSILVALLIS